MNECLYILLKIMIFLNDDTSTNSCNNVNNNNNELFNIISKKNMDTTNDVLFLVGNSEQNYKDLIILFLLRLMLYNVLFLCSLLL